MKDPGFYNPGHTNLYPCLILCIRQGHRAETFKLGKRGWRRGCGGGEQNRIGVFLSELVANEAGVDFHPGIKSHDYIGGFQGLRDDPRGCFELVRFGGKNDFHVRRFHHSDVDGSGGVYLVLRSGLVDESVEGVLVIEDGFVGRICEGDGGFDKYCVGRALEFVEFDGESSGFWGGICGIDGSRVWGFGLVCRG